MADSPSSFPYDDLWTHRTRSHCPRGFAAVVRGSRSGQTNERYALILANYCKGLNKPLENLVGFTMVHGHFMQMGGFTLYSVQGRCLGVTKDPMQLSRAIQVHGWILPTMDEIMDKSKGDNLSKALAVGQTGWFIVQSVSRLTTGFAISQIEVVTLALAAVNGVIYFLWWNKPLNVRYPVRVHYGKKNYLLCSLLSH